MATYSPPTTSRRVRGSLPGRTMPLATTTPVLLSRQKAVDDVGPTHHYTHRLRVSYYAPGGTFEPTGFVQRCGRVHGEGSNWRRWSLLAGLQRAMNRHA